MTFLLGTAATLPVSAETVTVALDIRQARWELRPGLVTTAWSYNGTVPGTPIVARVGDRLVVEARNRLPVATNIHWHGLEVPNDQDGPGTTIEPGAARRYEFTLRRTGTYWYHPHQMPVLPQLDRGLYGALVVLAPEDSAYSGDHLLVLDDWLLDAAGRRLEGTGTGAMERLGNVETVNGKTGEAIEPLSFVAGGLYKLRIVNASTAAVHTLRITGHRFRVTHLDGHGVAQPWLTETINLSPGERIDAEVEAVGRPGSAHAIESDRPRLGASVPIRYEDGALAAVASPYRPPASVAPAGIVQRAPDHTLVLGSAMGMGGGMMGGGVMGGGHDMHGSGPGAPAPSSMMRWTINGRSFPETDPLFVRVGEVVKVRFENRDTRMMHPMDHPIHLHGTRFLVVAVNGQPPDQELWKDTVSVPAGGSVEIAFAMPSAGEWMLHCHIIDHEDGGMMTVVIAEERVSPAASRPPKSRGRSRPRGTRGTPAGRARRSRRRASTGPAAR